MKAATAVHPGVARVATVVPFSWSTHESSHAHSPVSVAEVGSTPVSVNVVV